jgi:O-antigen ligase/tetratricopeptide (TPR) repeat protein
VRRGLLGLLTALIVARPLILGEDPGLLVNRLSDASNLVLTQLWLVAAVGWAVWRVWCRQGTWYASLVDAGLVGVVLLQFASAHWAAAYHHPAYLVAWEWLDLLVIFCLVRQLARTPGDSHGLLAALLASAFSLSAFALWQYAVELPILRERFANSLELHAKDPYLTALAWRLQQNNVFSTFAHPNSFGGFLALMLPAAVGGALISGRRQGWSWHSGLVTACALLIVVALWLTHSRGAIVGVLLVGAVVLFFRIGRRGRQFALVGAGLALAVFLLIAIRGGSAGIDLARRSLEKRLDYWTATWKMIHDPKHPKHFWLGVGPGNFGRYYPRYMAETAYEQVTDPHNFALEMWATGGIGSLAALLAALAIFFWKTRRAWSGVELPIDDAITGDRQAEPDRRFGIRWEFYLGGSAGLFLGCVLGLNLSWQADQTFADVLVGIGPRVGLCCLGWFAAFAVMEGIPWTWSSQRLVTTAGALALLLNLTVSGGICFPSVAQPLWIMAALAWNTLPSRPITWRGRNWLSVSLPVPFLLAACLICGLFAFLPVSGGIASLREAADSSRVWDQLVELEDKENRDQGPDMAKNLGAIRRQKEAVLEHILRRLKRAADQDPGNAYAFSELARWLGESYTLAPKAAWSVRSNAARWAHRAVELDPEGKEGYLTEYQLNMRFAQHADVETKRFHELAAHALEQAVKRDPTDAHLHFQFAEVLFKADKPAEARREAEEAHRLDQLSTEVNRKLTESQRKQIQKWLHASPAGPSESSLPPGTIQTYAILEPAERRADLVFRGMGEGSALGRNGERGTRNAERESVVSSLHRIATDVLPDPLSASAAFA